MIGVLIVCATLEARLHQAKQVVRPRQAADMRGHDPIGILLQRHRHLHLCARGVTYPISSCQVRPSRSISAIAAVGPQLPAG
jgi:hypothetical protein